MWIMEEAFRGRTQGQAGGNELEEEEDGETSNFTYVIVAVYFTTLESVIVYRRNTRRPCYV